MKYSLAITLGHNSSAVLIKSGVVICGYEEERLSGIKSDSAFPFNAISKATKEIPLSEISDVYVSHWATDGKVDSMSKKHWSRQFLELYCHNAKIHADVDHHDCHVEALRVFTGEIFDWEIVADGFGNFNEVLSIYNKGNLVHRAFGFEKSIGLLYQYATAYLGMKMNQDEYKLLGYESHIKDFASSSEILKISGAAIYHAKKLSKSMLQNDMQPKYDMVAGIEALPNIRLKCRDYMDYVIFSKLGYKKKEMNELKLRVLVAFYVQTVVEETMSNIVRSFGMKEVALTGGIFMNVKLNNSIAKNVGRISIMPLCGDQGCGLGAYQAFNNDLVWPDHLFWGKRDLDLSLFSEDKLQICDEQDAVKLIVALLSRDKIVNVVRGSMEFGARALGNTSTLALPTERNVRYINDLNQRSTIMPMAGMCTNREAVLNYKGSGKVHKSLEYMIITLDRSSKMTSEEIGCHHEDPLVDGLYTNRVQILKPGHFLFPVLVVLGQIINTSFNKHGVPIVFNEQQILDTHNFQKERDIEDRMFTIIVK